MSLLLRRFRLAPTTISLHRVAAVGPRCSIPPCAAVAPVVGVTSTSTAAPSRTSTTTTLTSVRFLSQHGAKRGQHIQRLEEIATSQEHEAAVDRRRKKKEKETARKSGVGKASSTTTTHAAAADEHDDFDDDEDSDEEDGEDGPFLPDPKDIKERMQKQIEAFKGYLKSVRGSEPTAEMFDDISVADAYGKGTGLTPLKSVAQVVISSPTLATATCYVRCYCCRIIVAVVLSLLSLRSIFPDDDKSYVNLTPYDPVLLFLRQDPAVAKAVVLAIQNSMKNLNPQKEENGVIKIPLPRPSKELRMETVKSLHKRAEQFRVRLRKMRGKSLKVVKQGVAGHLEHISKDEAFRVQQELEKVAEDMIGRINSLSEEKEKAVMQI
jgi:ribosome recycling factor